MALFKILKGKSANLPANKVNGYCYVTIDEHKLYVDYTKDDGTLDRFALNAVSADQWKTARNLNGMVVNGTSNVVNYGTCSTAAATAAKVVSCSNFALITGAEITVKFTTTNTAANPTLNVNSTGAKDIYYRGSAINAGYLAANRTYTFRYNGSQYDLVGDLDTNTTYGSMSIDEGTTGTATTNRVLTATNLKGIINAHAPTKTGNGASGTWGINISGNAATATKLATARTISLTGDVTGSGTFDGSSNLNITTAVSDNSHNHNSITSSGTKTMITNTAKWPAGFTVGDIYTSGYPFSYGSTWMYQGTFGAELIFNGLGGDAGVGTGHVYFRTRSDWETSTWGDWKKLWCTGDAVTGAVWNDYAEYRESDCEEFGYVLMETGDDSLTKTTERLSHFAGVSSDTWGFSQGETDKAKTPIAVAGRVLVYPYQDRNNYKPGDCVCAAPGGTVDIMTREEVREWPDRIVGTVSCVPDYEEWGGGEGADRDPVKVNGRIWIKVV